MMTVWSENGFLKSSWAHVAVFNRVAWWFLMQCQLKAQRSRTFNGGLLPCSTQTDIRPVAIVDRSINRTIKKNELDNFSGRDNSICMLVCFPRLSLSTKETGWPLSLGSLAYRRSEPSCCQLHGLCVRRRRRGAQSHGLCMGKRRRECLRLLPGEREDASCELRQRARSHENAYLYHECYFSCHLYAKNSFCVHMIRSLWRVIRTHSSPLILTKYFQCVAYTRNKVRLRLPDSTQSLDKVTGGQSNSAK